MDQVEVHFDFGLRQRPHSQLKVSVMFEMGLIVGLGLLVTLFKLNWSWRVRILSKPLLMDAIIFIGLIAIHWGTFSGVMVATIGAFVCSIVLGIGRKLVGYIEHGDYVPGVFNVSNKL